MFSPIIKFISKIICCYYDKEQYFVLLHKYYTNIFRLTENKLKELLFMMTPSSLITDKTGKLCAFATLKSTKLCPGVILTAPA